MAQVDENLTDVQRIETAIANLNNGVSFSMDHNLKDRDDNPITPDSVNVEVVSYPALEGGNNPCNIVGCVRIPSSPEDGTQTIEVRASEQNVSGSDWDIVLQITSNYYHSIQSDDHTPEQTAQAGTPINDCTPL